VGSGDQARADAGEVVVWMAAGDTYVLHLEFKSKVPVWSVAAREDEVIAWGDEAGSVSVRRVKEGEADSANGHAGGVNALAFEPGGSTLLSAGADGVLTVWRVSLRDADPNHPLQLVRETTFRDHGSSVTAVAFVPGGMGAFASADSSGKVFLRQANGKVQRTLTGHTGAVTALAFSPDGRRLATAGADHTVRIWGVESGAEEQVLRGHTEEVRAVAFSPDGQRVASAGQDKSVRLWALDRREETLSLPGRSGLRYGLAFHPTGRQLAAATVEGLRLWNADLPGK
jgi:tricorn protease-like protein